MENTSIYYGGSRTRPENELGVAAELVHKLQSYAPEVNSFCDAVLIFALSNAGFPGPPSRNPPALDAERLQRQGPSRSLKDFLIARDLTSTRAGVPASCDGASRHPP